MALATKPAQERARCLIPNSRLEVVPDCALLAPFEQTEAVNRALRQFFQPMP